MILSRFWYLLLTGAACVGIAAALLAASLINEQYRRAVVSDLVRDRFEVEAILKLDARTRLDEIVRVSTNGDVRTALRRASARRDRSELDEELASRLLTKLTELNGQLAGMRGDLLFAVDDEGWVIAGIAPTPVPAGAGLGQFPLVRRALEGYIRDDVWVYNDGVYRMAARPVVEAGQYVGAVVHGMRFDDELAELISRRLDGASVAFFRGETMVAGYMPSGVQNAPRRDEDIGARLEQVLTDERLQAGEQTDPVELPTGGLAVYSLVTGTARFANVGYAVGRPVRSLARPHDIFKHASGEAWASLPWEYLGGAGALTFLLAMFFVWVERDRPLSNLKKASEALGGSPEDRFTITDFGGRYRKIAHAVNKAIDRAAEAGGGPKRQAANLDELLDPAEGAASSGSFFGFQGDDAPPPDFQVPSGDPAAAPPPAGSPAGGLPPAASALGAPPPPAGAPPPPEKQAPPAPAARPRPPPPKPPAPRKPAPAKPAAPAAPAKPAAPAAPAKPAAPVAGAHPVIGEEDDEEPTALVAPPPSQRRALKSTLLGVAPPSDDDDDDDDDGATMVSRVPEELLRASGLIGTNEEETHFREVFAKFVETKKQCGEPTGNLTFEKFAVTLRKNSAQIIKRHGASRVRFTVYTKNGKAALKATPIKE